MKKELILVILALIVYSKQSIGQATSIYRNNSTNDARQSNVKTITVSKSFRIEGDKGLKILNNRFRNIEIVKGSGDSVTLVAKLNVSPGSSGNNLSWENVGLTVREEQSGFVIEGKSLPDKIPAKGGATSLKPGDTSVIFNKNQKYNRSNETLVIYFPNSNWVDIESRFSDIRINMKFDNVNVDCQNCFISSAKLKTAEIKAKYSDVVVPAVESLSANLQYGTLDVMNIGSLSLESNICEIKVGSANHVELKSSNDEIEIDSVSHLTAQKKYGKIAVRFVEKSLSFDGQSSDLSIDKFSSGLESVRIKNAFSSMSMSLSNIPQYSIASQGSNSTIYAPFQFTNIKQEGKDIDFYQNYKNGKGGAKFDIYCDNCKIFLK